MGALLKNSQSSYRKNGNPIAMHRTISEEITEDIKKGRYSLGDKLPSQSELVKKYNVSVGTARQSLENLEKSGIIRRETGRGSFVSLQSNVFGSSELRSLGFISETVGDDENLPAELQILQAFSIVCRNEGIRLMCDQTDFDAHLGGGALIETFKGIPLDGICAFLHYDNGKDITERVAVLGREFKAAVLFYAYPFMFDNLNIDCIDINIETGVRQLIGYLLAMGHTRIAYVGPHITDGTLDTEDSTGGRWSAYKGSLAAAGLGIDPDLLINVPSGTVVDPKHRKAVINLIKGNNPATAIFANNDWMARQIMEWLWKEDIRVPYDVCLAGFDDIDFSKQLVPSLTTVAFPFMEVAQTAVSLLRNRLNKPDSPIQKVTLNTTPVIRTSTCSIESMKLSSKHRR